MKTSQPADSQSPALEEQLVGKAAPLPCRAFVVGWLAAGGWRRVVSKGPLESYCYHVMSRTCHRV